VYKTVSWNTGAAAMRFRLKNKKKQQAPSPKQQASSSKLRPDYLRLKKNEKNT